jgi:hypothetical protein
MRGAAALLVGLAIAVSGCGGDAANVSARGTDAAQLVPPDALAFISADANLQSEQWRTVLELTGGLAGFQEKYQRDLRPALGDEVNLALLGVDDGEPEAIALVHPDDEAKLREFAAEFDSEDEHYTVEQIGGWHVVADSPEAFAAVRSAESGRSLADVDGFQRAMREVEGDSLATAYADAARLDDIPGDLGALFRVSHARSWIGARLFAEDNAARVSVRADAEASVFRPRLLRDVPSGALLAITFKDAEQLLQRIQSEPSLRDALGEYRSLLADLAPALAGEGVFYVVPGVLIPTLVLEVESETPVDDAIALRRVARSIEAETEGALKLNVVIAGKRVILSNSAALSGGPKLVDDQPFKDALAAADAPDEVTWLAYADLQRLVPTALAVAQLLGGEVPSEAEKRRLERLGTLVAYGVADGLELRITGRE